MKKDKFEKSLKALEASSEVAEAVAGLGIPVVGTLVGFAKLFYDNFLQKRFVKFLAEAEVDQNFIEQICNKEKYATCFYAALETVRHTHSKIGVSALALIYHDHWDDESFLISAVESFSRISDKAIDAFITLYEELPADRHYLDLIVLEGEERLFHPLYNEAVELIRRNFFVMTRASGGMTPNGPIQGMAGDHTKSYYDYCVAAKALNPLSASIDVDPV